MVYLQIGNADSYLFDVCIAHWLSVNISTVLPSGQTMRARNIAYNSALVEDGQFEIREVYLIEVLISMNAALWTVVIRSSIGKWRKFLHCCVCKLPSV